MGGAVPPRDRNLGDRDLVVAFQSGDEKAYDEVYRRYTGRVRRICVRMLGNTQDADEAVQETFLKAYQALGRFNGSYQLGAWLARIAANVCVDHVRFRARSARLVSLDADHETIKTEKGPEELFAGSDPRLETAIGNIQPLHAEALKLRALGGLSHEEMAGKLSMTPAQVKALLHRARTSFKRAWDRAEALTLVPLFGLRSLMGDRSQEAHAGSNLVGSSWSFSPLLAERVAASAVMVVVALTGAPSTPAPAPDGAATLDHGIAATQPVRPQRAATAPTTTVEGRPPAQDSKASGAGIAALLGADDTPLEADQPRRSRRAAHGGGGVTPAGTKPIVKKARHVVERAQYSVRVPSR